MQLERKNSCPLENKCLTTTIIYEANVTSDSENSGKNYIGLTEGTLIKRFYSHQLSFKILKYLKSSELSKHIWKVKDQSRSYRISWTKATPYINGTERCDLCLSKKLFILKANNSSIMNILNKTSKLISKRRHENKFYIKNYNGKVT